MTRTLVLLTLVALMACGDKDEDDTGDRPVTAADSAAQPRKAIFSEAEAIGVLRAIGDAEISMSRPVPEISQNDAVLRFARVVIADHQGIAELIKTAPQESGMSNTIRAAGDSIARAFLSMEGGFNNTYIEEQIKAHQQALQLMDTAIIPSVRDTATRTLMQQIRPTIAAHLQRAMQILSIRRKEAAERGEAWVSGFQPRPARDTTGLLGRPVPGAQEPPRPQPQPQPQPQPVPYPLPVPIPDTLPPPTTTSNM